jgi:hypothetical protein
VKLAAVAVWEAWGKVSQSAVAEEWVASGPASRHPEYPAQEYPVAALWLLALPLGRAWKGVSLVAEGAQVARFAPRW